MIIGVFLMSLYTIAFLLTSVLMISAVLYFAVSPAGGIDEDEELSRELSEKARLAFQILRDESSSPEEAMSGFDLALEAARGGIRLGMKTVMASYFFGRGVRNDFAHARHWARRLADIGDSSGKWVYIEAFMKDPENNFIDSVSNETDMEKYRRLCGRTVDQRADEIRAIDYGVELMPKYRRAELFIASLLWSHPAEGNNEAALEILERFTPESRPKIAVLKYLTRLGSTIATYRIFYDTYPAASARAAMMANAPEDCEMKLKRAEMIGPVRDAACLPLKSRKLKDRIMIRGAWDERWTFSVRGREVQVEISFRADGMGGASYSIRDPFGSFYI
jgi:hypothetical protein